MSLVICPKTTERVIATFTKELELRKVPKSSSRFWHGNFKDYLYTGLDERVKVLFTGYSGAVVGHALIEYASEHISDDPKPEVYFVGSVFAFRDSKLEPGDLAYASKSYSPDSFEQSIYKNAHYRGINCVTLPDSQLLERVLSIAVEKGINISPSKVYCRITPGHKPDFCKPSDLMNEAMWHKLSLKQINQDGYDSGEYESASALACSRLFGIPAVALLDVKDKRYSESDYKIASPEQKKQALHSILTVIRESIVR